MRWKAPVDDQAERLESQSQWAEGSIKLPHVSAGDRVDVAARINDLLFLALTGMPTPEKVGATFTLPDTTSLAGTTSLDFKSRRNDGRLLTLEVRGESCGAYCEEFVRVFNFDARTGIALTVEALFGARGAAYVEARMRKERERRYVRELKQLRARPRPQDASEAQDLEDSIALNEACLEEVKTAARSRTGGAEAPRYDMWLLEGPKLLFQAGRCSNHAMRALDAVGEVTLGLKLAEVSSLLTDYGKALLLGKASQEARLTSPFGNIVHGTIGEAPITMWLEDPAGSDSVQGIYFYDKYRKPLALSGTRSGANLELIESSDDPEQATITLAPGASGLTGRWSRDNKSRPVELRCCLAAP